MSEFFDPSITKWVPDYEGLYSVDINGLVYSHNYMNKNKTLILAQYDNGTGYMFVGLQKNCTQKKIYVHRLVLLVFKGESNLDCNHKDYNRKNNNINNLEYVTKSENAKHRERRGTRLRDSKGKFTKQINLQ